MITLHEIMCKAIGEQDAAKAMSAISASPEVHRVIAALQAGDPEPFLRFMEHRDSE